MEINKADLALWGASCQVPTRDLTTSSTISAMGNSNAAPAIVVIAVIAFAIIKAINNRDDDDMLK